MRDDGNRVTTSVEVNFDAKLPILSWSKRGRTQEPFCFEVFAIVVRKSSEGTRFALVHTCKSCEPVVAGDDLRRICFQRGAFDQIRIELDDGVVPADELLRLCFFAWSDVGSFVISLYPGAKQFARELLFHHSHSPKGVAFAQHLAASWVLEAYASFLKGEG